MPDMPMAQRLLSLFTSPECAEAIAGDSVPLFAGSAAARRRVTVPGAEICAP